MVRFPMGIPDAKETGLGWIGFGSLKTGPIDQGRQHPGRYQLAMSRNRKATANYPLPKAYLAQSSVPMF